MKDYTVRVGTRVRLMYFGIGRAGVVTATHPHGKIDVLIDLDARGKHSQKLITRHVEDLYFVEDVATWA